MPDRSLVIQGSVDTHCHTGPMADKGLDPPAILSSVRTDGLRALIDVGLTPADLRERRGRLDRYPWIALSSGMHPSEIRRAETGPMLDLLESQLEDGGVVAVGEIGLDYHWDTGERRDAIDLFATQVLMAVEANLPVMVHNREANIDVLEVLRRHRPRGVMHCFSQDPEFCRQCLDLDMHISFGGNLTFKGSDQIRAAAKIVPLDRLLVETDAPYLSPEPVRGRPNHPGHLGFTLRALAELRGLDIDQMSCTTSANAASLFGL